MQPAARLIPRKTREIRNSICDSTRWNGFEFRDDDIVIATYGKTGTTLMQQIVGQLIFRGDPGDPSMHEKSPWVDMRLLPINEVLAQLESQQHRRFLKTHLTLDALVFSPLAKYIYVGRDGRDTVWSLYNHHAGYTPQMYELINNIPDRVGPPLEPPSGDVVQYFREWLAGGGHPLGGTFWEHNQQWWNVRNLPNVLLVHYNNLRADLPGEIRRIAKFLDIEIDETRFPAIVESCSFESMQKAADEKAPMMKVVWEKGAHTFFNKGTNGRWRDVLSESDLQLYQEAVNANLTPDCAHWVATGAMAPVL